MFTRSLAFSAITAVLASSLLLPAASARVERGAEQAVAPAAFVLPEVRLDAEPLRASKTAWQARIEARLRTLGPAAVPEVNTHASGALVTQLETLATTMDSQAQVGIAVKDLQTGQTVFEHHGGRALNPASNHKLLTATAAMTLLGEDYRFETTVLRDGNTLFLRGGGDPSLQVEDLQTLAASIDRAGIERIVVDDSMFSTRTLGPGYDTHGPGFSYMAPSGALSLQYNTVVVRVTADRSSDGVTVALDPPCEHLQVERGRSHGSVFVTTRREGDKTIVRVDGQPRRGAPVQIRRRVGNPGRFTASVLASVLGRPRLKIGAGTTPPGASVVAQHRSAALPGVLSSALKFSNNFTTEQVLRTLGHHATNAPGDWDNGAQVLRAFWRATGQDSATLKFENASGLSAHGRVTPHAMVELVSLWADDDRAQAVMDALPVAGREGTLRGRLRRSGGRVLAKTGTLHDATGLTGIVKDRHGEPRYAFSVLVGGPHIGQAKRFQDRVVMALLRG
ncbi:MAG: D-alanyl-D-alanine carboxypeptidase/D-alanyl-D-alanine-endopeptidase [Nannocystaceae bacterium]|nr:D-alanyl-D-alanine carboxypeptidase/D-alanyl-D-alanine-endopeptidase [Nannocystaceae bacterium]